MPPIWIERPQEASFQEWLKEPQFSYWQLEGEGGIGKTSLLERFRDKAADAKKVAILMPADLCIAEAGQDGVNLLLNLYVANAPSFEKVRDVLHSRPSVSRTTLQAVGTQVEVNAGTLSDVILSNVDDSSGPLAKNARDVVKFVPKLWSAVKSIWNTQEKAKREAILAAPEVSLLTALAEDLKKGGVWLIDTWEKEAKDQISSRLKFPGSGQMRTPAKAEAQKYTLHQWLNGVSA